MFVKKANIKLIFVFVLCVIAVGAACSGQKMGQSNDGSTAAGASRIQGSGASFPKPIYEKWVNEFGKLNSGVKIDYQATGSGAG